MVGVPSKLGRARVKNYFTGDPNNIEFCQLSVDPRLNDGVPARVGSLGGRDLVFDSELYQKFGPLDTQWKLLENLSSNSVKGVCFDFEIADWASCDVGENYCLEFVHNLNADCLVHNVFNLIGKKVIPQDVIILSANSLQLKVSQLGVDGRFSGKSNIYIT